MSMTIKTTTATTEPASSIALNGDTKKDSAKATEDPYRYAHLMQTCALSHPNPCSFLDSAHVVEMTPEFGSDVRGCNLAELSSDQKDQLTLEVARRGVVVFRDQQDFIDHGAKFYTDWGRHFGPLHIHPMAGHPEGYPEIHLV
ncbi:hypothetical protein B0H10DRAFT_2216028 [Mycena sp. CBHHK59/15]|nr:hypothetical protein B0H10DRAFT_2216028 [Mycena sp. CBHHK59/15]